MNVIYTERKGEAKMMNWLWKKYSSEAFDRVLYLEFLIDVFNLKKAMFFFMNIAHFLSKLVHSFADGLQTIVDDFVKAADARIV